MLKIGRMLTDFIQGHSARLSFSEPPTGDAGNTLNECHISLDRNIVTDIAECIRDKVSRCLRDLRLTS